MTQQFSVSSNDKSFYGGDLVRVSKQIAALRKLRLARSINDRAPTLPSALVLEAIVGRDVSLEPLVPGGKVDVLVHF